MSIPGPADIKRQELDNGIIVLVRENHASPSVVVSGYLVVGAYDEADEQAGLSSFAASALTRGTETHTFDQLYERVESVGASFGISGGIHHTGFGAKSLSEDLSLILSTLADALRNPTFPAQEIEKLRGEILTDLEEQAHDTSYRAGLAFRQHLYPQGHPYRRSLDGNIETVSALTRDQLADFYQNGYGPQGMVITLVGGIASEQAIDQVKAAFGDWKGAAYSRPPLPPVSRPKEILSATVEIPGKIQSDIRLGYPGPARTDPAFLDAAVCNTILGIFGMYGRLGKTVREEQGLAYYSYSQISGGLGPNPWAVIAGVDPSNVDRAVQSIRSEIRRICQELVPLEELNDSQAFLVGSLPLRLETNGGVARYLLDMERYNLGLDYLQHYRDLIQAITPQRIQTAAQTWLDPDAYVLAVAGPKAQGA